MKKFKKEHKFLFASIIFSLLVSITFSALIIMMLFDDSTTLSDILVYTVIPLFPTLLITLISFIAVKTFLKHAKITKIITGILITFILLLQCLIYFVIFCLGCGMNEQYYNKPKNYIKAKNSINSQPCIKHFPEEIPKSAMNIKMEKTNNGWFGSEEIFLKFDTDKQYINNELKKYKFNYIENAEQTDHSFARDILNKAEIPYEQEKDFTFYIINDKESETPHQSSFPYHYGIITNKDRTTIIYYYMNPD